MSGPGPRAWSFPFCRADPLACVTVGDMTSDEQPDTTNTDDTSSDTGSANEETVGPELTQEDLDRAGEKMDGLNARYETGARETVTLPGTGGTVSGTAFADFDEDGASEISDTEKSDTDKADTGSGEDAESEKGERQPT